MNKDSAIASPGTGWTYDERNRLDLIQHLTQATGGTVVDEFDYELNDAGNITKITEVDDSYWTYAYDVRDRLTTASLKNASGNVSADWSYTYDDADNMLTKVAPFMDDFNDGNYTGWTVGSGTWSASSYYLEDTGAGGNTFLWKNDFTDDDHEARFRIQQTNSTAYTGFYVRYINSSNFIRLEFSSSNSTLTEKVSGTPTYTTNSSAGLTEDTWYNVRVIADGTSVKVWLAEDGEMPDEIHDVTVDGSLDTSSKVGFFSTDGTTVEYDDVWLIGSSLDNTYTMTYNTANELTSMTQPNGAGTLAMAYDDYGRMTNKSVASTFNADLSWRYGHFLEEFDSDFPDEGTVSYVFGGDKKRRTWSFNSEVLTYNWSRYTVINEENNSGTLVRTFIGRNTAHIDGNSPSTGDAYFYVSDNVFSTRSIYGSDKASVGIYRYSPFGVPYASENSISEPSTRLYTGHDYESISKYYYSLLRFLSSREGIWLNRDPEGLTDGPNLYRYVRGNPIGFLDATGGNRGVWCNIFGHCWIRVDNYGPNGGVVGYTDLHWSPTGWNILAGGYHVNPGPRKTRFPDFATPFSEIESTEEEDRRLIENWRWRERDRQWRFNGIGVCWWESLFNQRLGIETPGWDDLRDRLDDILSKLF